jgi:hypothetical protein
MIRKRIYFIIILIISYAVISGLIVYQMLSTANQSATFEYRSAFMVWGMMMLIALIGLIGYCRTTYEIWKNKKHNKERSEIKY